jgi:hypothetical protein
MYYSSGVLQLAQNSQFFLDFKTPEPTAVVSSTCTQEKNHKIK